MRKPLIISILVSLLGIATIAYAAPTFELKRSIIPEIDSTYTLGKTSKAWLNVYTDEMCLNGDCKTAWPTGGGGGGSDVNWTWNTTSNVLDSDGASTTATTSVKSNAFFATSTTINSNFIGFTATRSTTSAATSTNFFSSILTATTGFLTSLFGTNATITNATTTNLNASGSFKLGSDLITDLTGTGLSIVSGALTAPNQSNWTYNGSRLAPSTTVGIGVFASSTFATTSIKNLLVGDATNTKQSVGGGGPESLSNVRSSANNLFIWSGLPGDTEGRWLVESSGLMGWGAGGSSDQDINLFRNAANNLTVQSFTADGTDVFRVNDVDSNKIFGVNTVSNYIEAPKLIVNGANGGALLDVYGGGSTAIRAEQDAASSVGFSSYVTGDAQLRFSFLADGTQRWGSGSAVGDTVLARVAANQLALTGTTGQARFGIGSSTPSRALTVNGDVYATGTVTGADGIFTTSFTLPNGSNPTVDATGEIALNTAHNALSVATSTTALEFPMYPPISFAFASSSWTGTTTEVSYVTLPNFDELITSGICFANGSAKIIVGNGTASSSLTTLSAGTTTVNVNTRFNKNGTRIIFALGTPSTVTTVNCKFERVYLR